MASSRPRYRHARIRSTPSRRASPPSPPTSFEGNGTFDPHPHVPSVKEYHRLRQAPRHTVTADADEDIRHVPQRTCVGCRRTRPKTQLLRLAATPEAIRFDERQVLPGRGAYVCPNPHCVDAAARRDGHAVQRALRAGPGPTTAHDTAHALDAARDHAVAPTPMDGTQHEEHTA